MRHEREIAEIQMVVQCAEIVGEGVAVVTVPRRIGTPVPSPIVRDAPEAMVNQVRDLELPHAGVESGAGDEHHRPAGSGVGVEQTGTGASLNVWHHITSDES